MIKHPQELFALPYPRRIGLPLFVIGLTIMIVSQITLWERKKEHGTDYAQTQPPPQKMPGFQVAF